jgi:hypothetical protein
MKDVNGVQELVDALVRSNCSPAALPSQPLYGLWLGQHYGVAWFQQAVQGVDSSTTRQLHCRLRPTQSVVTPCKESSGASAVHHVFAQPQQLAPQHGYGSEAPAICLSAACKTYAQLAILLIPLVH